MRISKGICRFVPFVHLGVFIALIIDTMTILIKTLLITLINETFMKNTYCLFQIKFITEYTNVQHIIITQI